MTAATRLMVLILLGSVLAGFFGEMVAWLFTVGMKRGLLSRVGAALTDKRLDFYGRHEPGYVTARAYEVFQTEPLFGTALISSFMTVFAAVGSLWLMWDIDQSLTLWCLALAPIYLLASIFYTGPIQKRTAQQQESMSRLNGTFVGLYSVLSALKLFNRERLFTDKFEQRNREYFQAEYGVKMLHVQFRTLSTIAGQAAPVLGIDPGGPPRHRR